MRVPPPNTGLLLAGLVAEPRSGAPAGGDGLVGAWSATRWEYTRAAATDRVDVVCDLLGMVALSLAAATSVLTFAIPGRGTRSIGGTWARDDDALTMRPSGDGDATRLRFRQSGDTLSWHDANSGWDFDGDGEDEAAVLVAVFVRL